MPHSCRFFLHVISNAIVVFLFVLFPVIPGQTETFPFLAETTADRVNVRAGQSQNFERLCQLDKGEEVIVAEKSFGWSKIQLPSRVQVYVSDKYVGRLSALDGEILVDRVNVRALANTQATIVGQLKKGDRVRILARREGWYTIEPLPQIYGWVSDQLIRFKSANTSLYHPRPRMTAATTAATTEGAPAPTATQAGPGVLKMISVVGYLRAVPPSDASGMSYELVVRNQPTYYIQGLKPMLDEFLRSMVTVEGTLNTEPGSPFARPSISVSKIQLVL